MSMRLCSLFLDCTYYFLFFSHPVTTTLSQRGAVRPLELPPLRSPRGLSRRPPLPGNMPMRRFDRLPYLSRYHILDSPHLSPHLSNALLTNDTINTRVRHLTITIDG